MADYFIYLDDITTAIKNLEKIIPQVTRENLKSDDILLGNVTANLETIGAAVKALPLALRKDHPEVEWRRYIGWRCCRPGVSTISILSDRSSVRSLP